MILKQLVLTEEENATLYELVSEELRHAYVYGEDRDMIDIIRVLLRLHDQLARFDPPERLERDAKKAKEADTYPTYPKVRRPRPRNNKAGEQ